jgi:hypothetical protein
MDLKRIISTFTYRIEAKPQGGFIAHATDASLPPLEAPTREELQQKIQANISAGLAREFPGLNLPSGNLPSEDPATGNKELKFDFHIETKPGGGFRIHSHDPNAGTIEGASHEEIEFPFAEKLAGVVGKLLLPELAQALEKRGGSGDVKVSVDRKVSFTANPVFQKPALGKAQNFAFGSTQSGNRGTVNTGDSSPITFEENKNWTILRFLLALLVVGALMYFFFHR